MYRLYRAIDPYVLDGKAYRAGCDRLADSAGVVASAMALYKKRKRPEGRFVFSVRSDISER
jgi:hypothetical protein